MRAVQLRVLGGAIARVPTDATAYAHRTRRIMAVVVSFHGPDDLARRERSGVHRHSHALVMELRLDGDRQRDRSHLRGAAMSIASPIRRPRARHAIGIALAATMVATMGVAAQSPSATPAPDAVTPPTRTTDRAFRGHLGRGQGDHRRGGGSWGMRQDGPWSGMRGAAGFGQRGLRPGSGVTVSTNDGTSLVLSTPDGWTRTIDTTGVVLTRDGVAVAIGDIQVGESVRVVQTRNADGSYTVTGIEVQPALAVGTVGTASTDGFTVVGIDGTTTTISVTPETTWSARWALWASFPAATAGRQVAVVGTLQADGSIVATRIVLN